MSETQDNKLDMWMLVEVMGRVRIAGHVTEQTLAGAGFFRIDVPATSKRDGFTRYYSAGAIHSTILSSNSIMPMRLCCASWG